MVNRLSPPEGDPSISQLIRPRSRTMAHESSASAGNLSASSQLAPSDLPFPII
jgi:hypothetical protein